MTQLSISAEAPGRREQNKLDTRRAIAAAALDLARRCGIGNFTVDQLAAEAGISRRTFFNYFHSAEDALTVSTENLLEHAVSELVRRPMSEPLLDAMIAALAATTKVENLSVCGELFRMADDNPELMRNQLHAWERAENRIVDAVNERLDGRASRLYVLALVGSVLSCVRAAMREWADGAKPAGSRTASSRPADGLADAADLENHIVNALTMLRDGFNSTS